MNTIQTDFETMLMTGTQTAFKFAKPYFLNTFEWYTEEEYNELCNLVNKNIDDIIALPFLTVANQRKLEVLECMLQYIQNNKPNFKLKTLLIEETSGIQCKPAHNIPPKPHKCYNDKILNINLTIKYKTNNNNVKYFLTFNLF